MKNAAFSMEELFRFLDAGVSAFHSTAPLRPFWRLRAM